MQDRRTTSGDTDMAYGYSGSLNSQDTDTSGSEHRELFVRDPGGKLLAMIDYTGGSVGQTRFYLTDDQDSTMATVPASGTTTTAVRYLYEPYGQTIRTWEDTGAGTSNSKYTEDGTANVPISDYNPFGYVSGYTEPDSGLIKFGTRYYAPKLATWTQADPESGSLENPLTLSPQGYALNDPCNKTDATGRSVVGCLFSSVGVVGGAFYIYSPPGFAIWYSSTLSFLIDCRPDPDRSTEPPGWHPAGGYTQYDYNSESR